MTAAPARPDTHADGLLVLDTPVTLPDVLDVVIVGGGPFGTAAAFRAKELGLAALVIDYDDLLKRIRDYAKDKQILPDFGGGDAMQFPRGGELIRSLEFGPIDKDEMCARWKGLYRRFGVPAQIGVEFTGLERDGAVWRVIAWNHNTRAEQIYKARHVVLGPGRGVPRRLDVTGNVDGLAFNLSDPVRYVGQPACVFGGGTSAAEAVIAISSAKQAAKDSSPVFWSYRGAQMPKVSKALAEVFFNAFVVNGNVRYLPMSEPVAVIEADGENWLSVRTARLTDGDMPPQTTQLEFRKTACLACIGEDIPEALLTKVGVPFITGGVANKKRIAVTPLLETRQPNLYLAGDLLSPVYLETVDFEADPAGFAEVKRRGNIKAALRDGVVVAEVVAQKLAGKTVVDVHVAFGEPAAPEPAPVSATRPPTAPIVPSAIPSGASGAACRLIAVLPNGLTTIGRLGTDIVFADDPAMSDVHAVVLGGPDGYMIGDKGSAQGVFVQPSGGRAIEINQGTIIRAGQQWLVVTEQRGAMVLTHYSEAGDRLGGYSLKEGPNIVGRESPDITVARDDASFSRRHFALTLKQGRLELKDLGSANGTYLKIRALFRLADGDKVLVGRQVLRFDDERVQSRPAADVTLDTSVYNKMVHATPSGVAVAVSDLPPVLPRAPQHGGMPPADTPGPPPAPSPAAPPTEPGVLFADGRKAPCVKGQTILEAAEKAGIKLDFDCRSGSCGIDPVRVISGGEHLNALGSQERDTLEDLLSMEPGPHRLACMARVMGPVVVEPIKQH